MAAAPRFVAAQDPSPTPEPTPEPTPDPPPPPDGTPVDAQQIWRNTAGNTSFNASASWNGGAGPVPGAGDVAAFTAAAVAQPNLASSLSISGLYFTGTGTNGYNLTRTGAAGFTLTGYATAIGAETGDGNAVAIGAENTSGTNTIVVPITLAPASGSTSTIYQAGGGTLVISGIIQPSPGFNLTKTGAGTLTLSGANTFTGATTINGGKLQAAANNALGGTSGITVNSGGTLLLSNSSATDRIKNTSGITLAGGTLQKGSAVNEGSASAVGMGALTLTANSTLDYTGSAGVLTFASFSPSTFTLSIVNYIGTGSSGGIDRLIFHEDQATRLGSFDFGFGAGVNVAESLVSNGFWEVYSTVAVPEPGTWIGGSLALAALAFSQRRRLKRLIVNS